MLTRLGTAGGAPLASAAGLVAAGGAGAGAGFTAGALLPVQAASASATAASTVHACAAGDWRRDIGGSPNRRGVRGAARSTARGPRSPVYGRRALAGRAARVHF